jgi:hypothetical protein
MAKKARIAVRVSKATKDRLETHVRATGMNARHLVEQAILHHLRALEELPTELVIPPRIVISPATASSLDEQMKSGTPTQALRALMRDRK